MPTTASNSRSANLHHCNREYAHRPYPAAIAPARTVEDVRLARTQALDVSLVAVVGQCLLTLSNSNDEIGAHDQHDPAIGPLTFTRGLNTRLEK